MTKADDLNVSGGFYGMSEYGAITGNTVISASPFGGPNIMTIFGASFYIASASSFPPVPGSPYVMPGFQQHNALMVN